LSSLFWLFLYVYCKRLQPAKGLLSSGWSEEVIYILDAAYGAFFGAYFLVANPPLAVALHASLPPLAHLQGSGQARHACEKNEIFLAKGIGA
jgi:hypothetical protein